MSYSKNVTAAAALTVTLLLSTAHQQANRPVTLKLWHNRIASSESFEKEVREFERQNPGIKVEITPTSGAQYTQVVNLAFRGGETPDVFVIPTDGGVGLKDLVNNKWAMPLNKWATSSWQRTFPADSFVEGTNVFDNNIYSAPFAGGGANYLALYINNKVFRDAGLVDASGKIRVPRTWAEQRQFSKQIYDRSGGRVYGTGFGAKQGDYVLNIQMQGVRASGAPTAGPLGYYFHNVKTGKFEFSSNPVFKQWFDAWIDMKSDGTLYPQSSVYNDEQIRPIFASGAFGMYVNGNWLPASLAQTNPDFTDYTVVTMPQATARASSFYYRGVPAGAELVVSSKTKYPEQAWKLFSFLNSRASANRWVGYGESVRVWPQTASLAKGKAGEAAKVAVQNNKIAPNFNGLRPQLADVKFKEPTPNFAYYVLAAFNGQLKKADVPRVLRELETSYNAALAEAVDTARKNGSKVTLADFAFPNWDFTKDQATLR